MKANNVIISEAKTIEEGCRSPKSAWIEVESGFWPAFRFGGGGAHGEAGQRGVHRERGFQLD